MTSSAIYISRSLVDHFSFFDIVLSSIRALFGVKNQLKLWTGKKLTNKLTWSLGRLHLHTAPWAARNNPLDSSPLTRGHHQRPIRFHFLNSEIFPLINRRPWRTVGPRCGQKRKNGPSCHYRLQCSSKSWPPSVVWPSLGSADRWILFSGLL